MSSRLVVSVCACLIIAACGGRTQNLNAGAVDSDAGQRLGERETLLSCTNTNGESSDSVFELALDGSVYRDGVLKTDRAVFNRNSDQHSYEISWISLLNDGTSRYDYLHHENEWLFDPARAGEEFIAVEQRTDGGPTDVVTYFEEGVSGNVIEHCGTSSMTDRNFLVCSETGPNVGTGVAKRKIARYDLQSQLLSVDGYVRNLTPRDNPALAEQLTNLGDGWLRYQRETNRPSFQGNGQITNRLTTEFNSFNGMVRSLESRDSPVPHIISCSQ